MKKGRMIIAVCLIVLIILYLAVRNQMVAKSPVDTDNAWNFGNLVKDLVRAYETPSEKDAETIAADLIVRDGPFTNDLVFPKMVEYTVIEQGKSFCIMFKEGIL